MLEPVPWFVEGAEHKSAVARMLAFSATNGSNGITLPGDFEVRALNVPGPAVQIYPGGATLLNQYPGVEQQSYIVRNITATQFEIPATGSSPAEGETNYVIVKIEDPNFGGAVPDSTAKGPYVFFDIVPNVDNLQYPHVVLAAIRQPASTGTIEQEMIEDLREMANPREKTARITASSAASDNGLALNASGDGGEWFPNTNNGQTFKVPSWATRAQITAYWTGVKYLANTNPFGQFWVEYGPYTDTSDREYSTDRFDFDSEAASNNTRTNWIAGDEVPIPASIRGTNQIFAMKARYWGGSDGATLDQHSGIILDVRFMETADPSVV